MTIEASYKRNPPALYVAVARDFLDTYMLDVLNRSPNDNTMDHNYWAVSRILQQHFFHDVARACGIYSDASSTIRRIRT